MKRNTKNIILWVLSAFMLISAIAFFPSASSIIMLLFAVIAAPIPVIQQFLSGKGLRGWVKPVLLVVLFAVSVFLAPTGRNSAEDASLAASPSAAPQIQVSEDIPPTPSATPTPEPSPSPSPSPSPTPSPTATPTPAPSPSPSPSPTPEPTPTPEPVEQMVWVSGNGKKYHSKSGCSGMKNPTQIPLSEAEANYEPCSKCY